MSSDSQNSVQPFYTKWANVPFAPSKTPFFYGWVIVFVSTLSIVFSVPGQTAGIGPFTGYLIDTLGIERHDLSLAYMIGTIISGFILPYAGKVLDKIGVRIMSVMASLGLAFSLLFLANTGNINNYFCKTSPNLSVTIAIASTGFFLVRFFGQGSMTMVGRVAMGRWFNHWRGIATAISGVPVAFAFNAAPWLMNKLIEGVGWREACFLLAAAVGGGMTILGALLFRDTPEECGLKMDGLSEEQTNEKQKNSVHKIYRQFTRPEAMKTFTFWAFVYGLAVHGLVITAVSFHITSIGDEMGLTKSEALKMFIYSSLISIPSRFFISFIVDNTKLNLKFLLMAMAVTIFSYCVGLNWFNTPVGHIVTIVGLGLSGGIWGILCDITLPRYFGRKHLGAISGLNMSVIVVASAIGPALFDQFREWFGGYGQAAIWSSAMPVVMFLSAMFVRDPQDKFKDDGLPVTGE